MAQRLRAGSVLAGDLGWVPNTHTGWLTTAWKSAVVDMLPSALWTLIHITKQSVEREESILTMARTNEPREEQGLEPFSLFLSHGLAVYPTGQELTPHNVV